MFGPNLNCALNQSVPIQSPPVTYFDGSGLESHFVAVESHENSSPEIPITEGIDVKPGSIMQRLMEIFDGEKDGEKGMAIGRAIGDFDRYAERLGQKPFGGRTLVAYLSEETDPDKARIEIKKIQLSEIKKQKANAEPKTKISYTRRIRDLSAGLSNIVIDAGNKTLGYLRSSSSELSKKIKNKNLKTLDYLRDLSSEFGYFLGRIAPTRGPKRPKNYLNGLNSLERAVVIAIDECLLPQELGKSTVDFYLLTGNLEGSIGKIREVDGMQQSYVEPKLGILSYEKFRKGIGGIKKKLNLEVMSGGSKVKKLWLKYGPELSAVAAGGIVAAAGAYSMFSGYDISQLFMGNQVDASSLDAITSSIRNIFSFPAGYNAVANEKQIADAALQGATTVLETANQAAAGKLAALNGAVDDFVRVDPGDSIWKSARDLSQAANLDNVSDQNIARIVDNVAVANDKLTPKEWAASNPGLKYPDGDYTQHNGQNPHLLQVGQKINLGNILNGIVENARNSIQESVRGAQLAYEQAADKVSKLEEITSHKAYLKNNIYIAAGAAAASALLAGVGSWLGISRYEKKSLNTLFPNTNKPEDQPPHDPKGGGKDETESAATAETIDPVIASSVVEGNTPGGANSTKPISNLSSTPEESNPVSDLVLKASVLVTESGYSASKHISNLADKLYATVKGSLSKVKDTGKTVNYLSSIGSAFYKKISGIADSDKNSRPLYKQDKNVFYVNFGGENQKNHANDVRSSGNDGLDNKIIQENSRVHTELGMAKSGLYTYRQIEKNVREVDFRNPDQEKAAEPVEEHDSRIIEYSKKPGDNAPIRNHIQSFGIFDLEHITQKDAGVSAEVGVAKNGRLLYKQDGNVCYAKFGAAKQNSTQPVQPGFTESEIPYTPLENAGNAIGVDFANRRRDINTPQVYHTTSITFESITPRKQEPIVFEPISLRKE